MVKSAENPLFYSHGKLHPFAYLFEMHMIQNCRWISTILNTDAKEQPPNPGLKV